ncbi:MAG TPA: protein arginine kinase [Parachlamydiaceae bacterium]|nr:protein arginine kinase [Parachlamydiaceae bacterium]
MREKVKNSNEKETIILKLKTPWDYNDNNIWLASSIEFYRNIEKYLFPDKLDTERQKQLISLVGQEIMALKAADEPALIVAEEINPLAKQYLTEHFLTVQNFQNTHAGEAFVIDKTGLFLASINIQDHLHLKILDVQGEIENSWNALLNIETLLSKSLPFAFSPKFGFLTSDPSFSGTAMIATVFLQLSGLVHLGKLDEILEKHSDESIVITGIQGNPTEIIGDVLAIRNNQTLGVSEENIISSLRSLITKLLTEENRARNEIKTSQNSHIKDLVSRAYGILIYSYEIEPVEALNAISLIKLGIEMGWISGLDYGKVNQLFFNCRRSHLLSNYGELVPQEEISHKRAEFIHEAFKDTKLII